MKHFRITLFEVIYIAISIATFQHSMWSAAMTFDGNPPIGPISLETFHWYFNGALLAITIDIGMLLIAKELRKSQNAALVIAFAIAALSSFYMQIMYSMNHTEILKSGAGVTPYWQTTLSPIMDARIILVPLMLPLFSVIYTIAQIRMAKTDIEEIKGVVITEQPTTPKQSPTPMPRNRRLSRKSGKHQGEPALPGPTTDQLALPQGEPGVDHEALPAEDASLFGSPATRGVYLDPRPENWANLSSIEKRNWRSAQRKKLKLETATEAVNQDQDQLSPLSPQPPEPPSPEQSQ